MNNRVLLGFLTAALTVGAQQQIAGPSAPGPVNLNFASGVVGQVPEGWIVPPTRIQAGFSAELRREGCHSAIGCAVLIPPSKPPAGRDAVLWQRFNAGAYRGSTIRVRGWVRLDGRDPLSHAQMEFRVERPNRQRGFDDAMADRPVQSTEWQLCEIVGKVADDAEYLSLAVTSVGTARAWIDDVTMEFVDSRTPLTGPDPAKGTAITSNSQPENLDFSQGEEGQVPPRWFVPPELAHVGYSAELRRHGCHGETGCAVVLVPASQPDKKMFGNLMQHFTAQQYRGRTLRLRAWVRLDAVDAGDRAQIWFRVDRPNQKIGFFDNMNDRPVRSSKWQQVEIVGRVDFDADAIDFGLMSLGKGRAWIDGITIEEVANQPATGRSLTPPSSEPANTAITLPPPAPTNLNFSVGEIGKIPPGWFIPKGLLDRGDSAELRNHGCWSGKACVLVFAPPNSTMKGILMQSFSGVAYRGKNFRLKARLRLDGTDPGDTAQISIRVFRNQLDVNKHTVVEMSDRSTRAADWTYCEISGRIADDAELIYIDVLSDGKGKAWADDIAFEILPGAVSVAK